MTQLLIDHLISLFIIILKFTFLLFTFKDLIKEKPFTSLLLVISTIAFLISFSINFNLSLGKHLIDVFYFISLICFISKLLIKKDSVYSFLTKHYRFLGLLFCSGLISFSYLLFNLNHTFIFNGHDPYFYGIPFEIIEGDYSTRIKIWDNYPHEWSKYHFFNGSLYSIFLLYTGIKNIFLWKLIKLIFLCFSYFFIEEVSQGFNKKTLFFFSFLICINSLGWMFETNGEFSTLFLFASFFYYFKKNKSLSLVFLVFFSCTLSRNLIPGIGLILIFFSKDFFRLINTTFALLFVPPVLNLCSTIFNGTTPLNRGIDYFLNGKFVGDFFYNGWSSVLFTNSIPNLFLNMHDFKLEAVNFFLILSSGVYFFIFFKTRNKKIRLILGLNLFVTISLFIAKSLLEKSSSSLLDYNFITIFLLIIQSLTFWFFLFYVINDRFPNKTEKGKLFLVIISLGINIFLFGSEVGIPTLYYFDVFVVFLLIGVHENTLPKNFDFLKLSFLSILILFFSSSSGDTTQHYYNIRNIDLNEIKTLKNNQLNSEELYLLNSNIFGARIYNDKIKTDRLSISKNFVQ